MNRHRENYRTGGPINMWKIQVSLASPPKVSLDPFFYIRFPTEGLPPRIFLTVGSDCHRFSSVLRCFYWQRTKDRWIARCRRESDKHAPKELISQHTDAGFFLARAFVLVGLVLTAVKPTWVFLSLLSSDMYTTCAYYRKTFHLLTS